MRPISIVWFLLLLLLPIGAMAMGRADGNRAAVELPESITAVADEGWRADFQAELTGLVTGRGIPAAVVAIVTGNLPDHAAALSPRLVAELVLAESLVLDRTTRRGEPVNRAALASARNLSEAVDRAAISRERNETTAMERPTAGPPPGVGGAATGSRNRASEVIRSRTSPSPGSGGSPFDIEEHGRGGLPERGTSRDDHTAAPGGDSPGPDPPGSGAGGAGGQADGNTGDPPSGPPE